MKQRGQERKEGRKEETGADEAGEAVGGGADVARRLSAH